MFWDCVGPTGGPESRSLALALAVGLHPVPGISPLGDLPPPPPAAAWLGSHGLTCCPGKPIAGAVFTSQVLDEVRSNLQLCGCF